MFALISMFSTKLVVEPFYKVIEYVFEKNNYIHLSGNEIKKHQINNEPDYYIRDNGKIYLFEYKDVLINAKTKHSYNINEIKDEISKKLIQNQNDSPKGVTQLVNVIEKIRNDDFKKIDNYDFQNVIIYPIIVYTDFSFTLSGINYLINREFWKQLEIRKIKNPHLIKDIVLIDLDLFIKFQDLFRDKTLKLNNCLNEYYDFIKKSSSLFDKIYSFNMFLHNKTRNMPYASPKMLMEIVKDLLK